jgi:prepilin-type processing-associated H-X9-DG protein
VSGSWLNGTDDTSGPSTEFYVYQKTAQMIRPSPAYLWVFVDEHPDSINDGMLAVQVVDTKVGGKIGWVDIPTDSHAGSCPFSFADGHAEMHHWLGPLMGKRPFIQGSLGAGDLLGDTTPNDPNDIVNTAIDLVDLNWIQARTSYPTTVTIFTSFPHY